MQEFVFCLFILKDCANNKSSANREKKKIVTPIIEYYRWSLRCFRLKCDFFFYFQITFMHSNSIYQAVQTDCILKWKFRYNHPFGRHLMSFIIENKKSLKNSFILSNPPTRINPNRSPIIICRNSYNIRPRVTRHHLGPNKINPLHRRGTDVLMLQQALASCTVGK